MKTDAELLRCYVEEKSEPAFTELVQRHIALVHSVALRRVGGDTALAEDVTQKVFNDLARKASTLTHRATISGWLYASAHLASAAVVRGERRRKARETEAHLMQTTLSSAEPDPDWAQLRPVIDDAIVALREDEREAIALRFFQKQSFAEIGAALRITEEAARKRVERALERLRVALGRRGVTSTAAALGLALGVITASSVPAGLAPKVAGQALASAGATTGGSVAGTWLAAGWPAAAMLILGGVLVSTERQSNHQLRAELARLTDANKNIATLRIENRQRAQQVARAEELRRTISSLPAQQNVAAAPVTNAPRRIGAVITVSESGTVALNGDFMSLREFVRRLREESTRMASVDPEACVHVSAIGAQHGPTAYVIDEARKAGFLHLTVDGNAAPDPKFNWWFMGP